MYTLKFDEFTIFCTLLLLHINQIAVIEQDRKSMKANRKLFIHGVDFASSTSGRHFSYYNDAVHWSDLVRADQRSSNVAQSTGTADRSFHNTAETLVHKYRNRVLQKNIYASFGKASLKACLLSYSLCRGQSRCVCSLASSNPCNWSTVLSTNKMEELV
ncbi:hypothetical protein T07_12863 [Trichinella nelsoni]|uniref:Uncharacterized protein n=1 Tax=Trichinella nelsoni TaxID=6336 RepID=A0A0V0SFI1_9BILA|nr:hypothetical protein T07_12863 [Trichinella nelsoni]